MIRTTKVQSVIGFKALTYSRERRYQHRKRTKWRKHQYTVKKHIKEQRQKEQCYTDYYADVYTGDEISE